VFSLPRLICFANSTLFIIKTIHKNTAPDVIFIPEISFNRGISVDIATDVLEVIVKYDYFKAIDLHGNEFASPISNYKKLYRKAKDKGLILKAHVDEFGDAESVREAVEELELNQVQHGIAAAHSNYGLSIFGALHGFCRVARMLCLAMVKIDFS